jgi:hypothetical protein
MKRMITLSLKCFVAITLVFSQTLLFAQTFKSNETAILPQDWDAKLAADEVLSKLIKVTAPEVKGAHDAEFVMIGDYAYIVAEVNEKDEGLRQERY